MFEEQDERDEDLDAEDAALDDENSDDDSDEDEEGDDDEDDESDDSEGDTDDKKSGKKSKDEDLDKPITKRQLQEILKSNQNQNNAKRRVASKGRDNKQPDVTNDRLSRIEQQQAKAVLLEQKRQFGHENRLSPAEVDVVFRLTKRPTKKFLERPEVKGAIEGIRSHDNVRNNTPSGSGQHFKAAGGKSWSELKPEEKEANFADRRRSILDSKKK